MPFLCLCLIFMHMSPEPKHLPTPSLEPLDCENYQPYTESCTVSMPTPAMMQLYKFLGTLRREQFPSLYL